jgi:hypothetical protein
MPWDYHTLDMPYTGAPCALTSPGSLDELFDATGAWKTGFRDHLWFTLSNPLGYTVDAEIRMQYSGGYTSYVAQSLAASTSYTWDLDLSGLSGDLISIWLRATSSGGLNGCSVTRVATTAPVATTNDGHFNDPLPEISGEATTTVPDIIVEFTEKIPRISSSGLTPVALCSFEEKNTPEISGVATTPITCWGNFVPDRPVVEGFAYQGAKVNRGVYRPSVGSITAAGSQSAVNRGVYVGPTPVVRATGSGRIEVQGVFSPPTPVISASATVRAMFRAPLPRFSGLSLPGITGAGRYKPPRPVVAGSRSSAISGSCAFVPLAPRMSGIGKTARAQDVLQFTRDSVVTPTTVSDDIIIPI